MSRLQVYRLPGNEAAALVLDVQADLLASLKSRVVVPLVPAAGFVQIVRDLNPVFELDGENLVMVTQAIATVPIRLLQRAVASLDRYHDAVVRALDILLLGL